MPIILVKHGEVSNALRGSVMYLVYLLHAHTVLPCALQRTPLALVHVQKMTHLAILTSSKSQRL